MQAWPTLLVLTELLSISAVAHATNIECADMPALFESFEQRHYSVGSLTDQLRARTVEQYIKALDPTMTLLLTDDVARMKKELPAVFDTMRAGNCAVLTTAFDVVLKRAEEDEATVRSILAKKDFALDETVELNLEPDKRGYCKTPEQRQELLRKMIHFQLSNYLVSGMELGAAKKQLVHRYELLTKRFKERKAHHQMLTMYAEAFATALDPHSSFMPADMLADFEIQMKLQLEGIGAALTSQDGFAVIESLVPGGMAEKSNLLRPKDKIIAVAQERAKPVSTIDMDLQEVVKMIRGKKGTRVTLTVLREGTKTKTFDAQITRDKIDIKEQAAKITYETRKVGDKTYKIGILDLPSFYGGGDENGRSSYVDVKRLLEEARTQKVDGLVLDLSRNGGGLLEDAVRISGLFIKRGGVVATRDRANKIDVLNDQDDRVIFTGPLAIMTSPASASASEILAGALKAYHRGVTVGSGTFGKGTVQVLTPLPHELGAIKVTTGMFFLPSGVSTQQRGVEPDVSVPSMLDAYDVGEKNLDYSLPPGSITSFVSADANSNDGFRHWQPIDDAEIGKLVARSKERVSKDPQFAEIRKQLKEVEENKGIVRLSELRKRAKEHDNDEDKDSKARFKKLEGIFLQEGVNIVADLVTDQAAKSAGSPGQAIVENPVPR